MYLRAYVVTKPVFLFSTISRTSGVHLQSPDQEDVSIV
jgi:hypothetical protein